VTTIELDEYDALLKKIADDFLEKHRGEPDAIGLLEQRMNALTAAARTAILKIASEVDFTGAQEFARLTADEALAWKLVVTKVRVRGTP
jgi:hypothetical protein